MPTAREIARQKSQLRKELERDFRKRQRAELGRLRRELKDARVQRRDLRKSVRNRCRTERRALTERAKAARVALREAVKQARKQNRSACARARREGDERTLNQIERAIAALERERAEQLRLRIWEGKTPRVRADVRRAESDDEVRNNLDDPMLRGAFEAVKHKIKPGLRSTRTEAFLQWAHDHPQQVYELSEGALEQSIAQLIRDEKKQRAAMRRPAPRYLEAVPF